MIVTRTPLRISLAGGGTDLPSYYLKHGSTFISAAINKYIYITLHRSEFDPRIRLRYSRMEEVGTLDEIQHDIIRETLRLEGIKDRIELTSHAEIPSGTGLGSSGSFGVGILKALQPLKTKTGIAEDATYIQMNILNHPIGIQDQYVASYGGVNLYQIGPDGIVTVEPFEVDLENKLVLFFTGFKRDANEILRFQKENSEAVEKGLHRTQELCYDFINEPEKYGEILNEQWNLKKERSPLMTNNQIDEWYNLGLKNGAEGGKIVGAGGGGFLLFYTHDREKLISAMPLKHIDFQFDHRGSIIYG